MRFWPMLAVLCVGVATGAARGDSLYPYGFSYAWGSCD